MSIYGVLSSYPVVNGRGFLLTRRSSSDARKCVNSSPSYLGDSVSNLTTGAVLLLK